MHLIASLPTLTRIKTFDYDDATQKQTAPTAAQRVEEVSRRYSN